MDGRPAGRRGGRVGAHRSRAAHLAGDAAAGAAELASGDGASEAKGRMVIAGAGAPLTEAQYDLVAVRMAADAAEGGADALLCFPPVPYRADPKRSWRITGSWPRWGCR